MTSENPLGYAPSHDNPFGRSPRKCLPCRDREEYIQYCAKKQISTITLRQKNRYIDEFITFVSSNSNYTTPSNISDKQIISYIDWLCTNTNLGKATVKTKLVVIKLWYEWMRAMNKMSNNPFSNIDINTAINKS